MTHTVIMTPKIWFCPIMVIMIVLSFILFKILIVNIELDQWQIIISVTLLYWSYFVMTKKKIVIMTKKTKFHNKGVVRSKRTSAIFLHLRIQVYGGVVKRKDKPMPLTILIIICTKTTYEQLFYTDHVVPFYFLLHFLTF